MFLRLFFFGHRLATGHGAQNGFLAKKLKVSGRSQNHASEFFSGRHEKCLKSLRNMSVRFCVFRCPSIIYYFFVSERSYMS